MHYEIFNKYGASGNNFIKVEERNSIEEEVIELMNLILSLANEMGIKEITYLEYLEDIEEE